MTRSCTLCGGYEEHDFEDHKRTTDHHFNFTLEEYNRHRKKLTNNKNDIEVSTSLTTDFNNNNIDVDPNRKIGHYIVKISPATFVQIGNKLQFSYRIKNASKKTYQVQLIILHPFPAFSLTPNNCSYILKPADSCTPIVKFSLDETTIGSFKIPLVVTAQVIAESEKAPKATTENEKKENLFNIHRQILIYIKDEGPEEQVVASGSSPFTGEQWNDIRAHYGPVKAPRLTNEFPIPDAIRRILRYNLGNFQGITVDEINRRNELLALFRNGLNESNYEMFFHNLLWLDETAAELGLIFYNMTNVVIRLIRGTTLELEVPGLAEKRPSIVKGDLVNLRFQSDHTVYQGVASDINESTIYVSEVHQEFLHYLSIYPNIAVDVKFEFSRLQHDRMHKGIEMCLRNRMLRSLFPSPPINVFGTVINLDRDDLYNRTIIGNPHQFTAVKTILNNTSQAAPYIVFGPPGTGKTITIVEAILQIKKYYPKRKILVCAPSNSACDMLCSKLTEHCTNKELIRVNSLTRNSVDLPIEIRRYCNLEENEFTKLTGKDLKQYNVVVSTLHLIGKFLGYYSPDCLFIDEAAQATEPECAIPIGLLSPGTQIILAGDPKQLGPVCSSDLAVRYGLGVSLMERLMKTNNLYTPRNANAANYDPDYLTMLKINYRSHAHIITIPNELFYNNSLECAGDQTDPISSLFISRKVLKPKDKKVYVKKASSVEFCGVLSKEERKGSSPSYFNECEIQMVMKYVKVLCNNAECRVLEKDIGIIAPYIRQVHKIKMRLKDQGFKDIEVGTTESFQGREKRVMIISTVRAQHSLLKYDRQYNLGFVKHERRFNVALTRAQSKLIIIGNPMCLGYDRKCWLKLIEYCEDLGAYFGIAYLERTHQVKHEISSRFLRGGIKTSAQNGDT